MNRELQEDAIFWMVCCVVITFGMYMFSEPKLILPEIDDDWYNKPRRYEF